MKGVVDDAGRAIVALRVRPVAEAGATELTVWIDTAFTGELVIPRATIETLGLQQSAAVMAGLADGTQVVLETFTCIVEWFGHERKVEVVENEGQFPLLGVGLLQNLKLEIDYRLRTVSIG